MTFPATGFLQQTALKWIVLYLPLRWPAGILTRPEIDQELGGTRPVEFAADLDDLVMRLERLTTPGTGSEWPTHPIFGRMSKAD